MRIKSRVRRVSAGRERFGGGRSLGCEDLSSAASPSLPACVAASVIRSRRYPPRACPSGGGLEDRAGVTVKCSECAVGHPGSPVSRWPSTHLPNATATVRHFRTEFVGAKEVIVITRRHLIHAATAVVASAGACASHAGETSPPGGKSEKTPRAHRKAGKTLLILGGTGFIGPHLTSAAQQHGWTVTHFNRGKAAKGGIADVETLIGDRNGDLAALRNRRFDAVIDDSGYVPKYVRASSALLAPNVGYYLFVSSISAYANFATPNDEYTSALGQLNDPEGETVTGETYGPMKVLCERYVRDALGERSCVVRPGYIVGPLDSTDRFTYWPVRASQGGEMLAPGTASDPVEYIDVRDLTEWMVSLIEHRTSGVFNAVTPPHRYTMGNVISTSLAASPKAGTRVTWVSGDFLINRLGEDGAELPPWSPLRGDTAALGLVLSKRAEAAGLRYRPLETTVRDTLQWFESLPAERRSKQRLLLTSQREAELLAAWHSSSEGRTESSSPGKRVPAVSDYGGHLPRPGGNDSP